MTRLILLFVFVVGCLQSYGQSKLSITILDDNNQPLSGAIVQLTPGEQLDESNTDGLVTFNQLTAGTYYLVSFLENFTTHYDTLEITDDLEYSIVMKSLSEDLNVIEVNTDDKKDDFRALRAIEGTSIFASKKSEVIIPEKLMANLATNNPRQIYAKVSGLNIWESDGAGIQLSIATRGLNPNRTSNFNTRQNGYDISADALGYPESYYTPPTQAVKRIEIVRGAASLQFGTQFGGMMNFALKDGAVGKPFEFHTEQSLGSFGFYNSFTSIAGEQKKFKFYAYHNFKRGDGWRPNSDFNLHSAHAGFKFNLSSRLSLGLEYSHLSYLAHQPGGLVDFEFYDNPRQGKRIRNWFKVDWNIAALNVDYSFSEQTRLNSRFFGLFSSRFSVGDLEPANRPELTGNRDLIKGFYNNFGNESRLIHRYDLGEYTSTLLVGSRYYEGDTRQKQGLAGNSERPVFEFLNPDKVEGSDFKFPSRNLALFTENYFVLNEMWTITPGARFEYIRTASEGEFNYQYVSGGEVLVDTTFTQERRLKERHFALFGLGTSFKPSYDIEFYANFSQNYRGINFNDMRISNLNARVDSLLTDEKGFNADVGLRGSILNRKVRFDVSLFHLSYQDRIGDILLVESHPIFVEQLIRLTTNVGNASINGLESLIEYHPFTGATGILKDFDLNVFANLALTSAFYHKTKDAALEGNNVELVPPFSLRSGLQLGYKNFKISGLFSYTGAHFTDATNAILVPTAVIGIIPAYYVVDLSTSWRWKWLSLSATINNLTDNSYFTRRASAYPGPGIIPSDGRSFHLSVGLTF